MKDRYLIRAGENEMRIVDVAAVKDVHEEFLLNHAREDIEVCHVSDDDVAFEFYEISDGEYAELGIEQEEE